MSMEKGPPSHHVDPEWHWVIWLAFGIVYLAFFVEPVFLFSREMQFFAYVPAQNPIGLDLTKLVGYGQAWASGARVSLSGRRRSLSSAELWSFRRRSAPLISPYFTGSLPSGLSPATSS